MTRKELERLQSITGYPCITIYIPTHRTMPERQKDRIMVKDMVGKAVDLLLKEFSKEDIMAFVSVLDKMGEDIDYTKLLDGIAIFVNKDLAELYLLPFPVKERVTIGNHFALTDIYGALNESPHYWVLALCRKGTRLFEGYREDLKEVIDTPKEQNNQQGFPFTWQWEVTSDRTLGAVSRGDRDAAYITRLQELFMHQVDEALCKHLNKDDSPLIILGTIENCSEFKKVSKHNPRIIAQCKGEYAECTPHEIATAAWPIMQKCLAQNCDVAIKSFIEQLATGKAIFGIDDVWKAAQEGRIHRVLVEEDFHVLRDPELTDPSKLKMKEATFNLEAKYDAVEQVLDAVFKTRGKTIFVPKDSLSDYGRIGAILRY